jgi:hypothetical protein
MVPISDKVFVCKDTSLQKAPYSLFHFEVNPSVFGMLLDVILFDDPKGKKAEWDFHILKVVKGSGEIDFFMSRHIYFAFGVLTTLFQCNFSMLISAVQTLNSPL